MSLFSWKILSNLKLNQCSYQILRYCTTVETPNDVKTPIISVTNYINEDKIYQKKRQVWIENLDTTKEEKLGLMTLHPDVFACSPRVDILYENIRWQRLYKYVSFTHVQNRMERRGGGRKPWPQKGLGRARHGSIRSPLFIRGGVAHGPRSPKSHFYMLPFYKRVLGLTTALSIKLAQDDMHLVKDLDIPTAETSFIENLIEERRWGPSVLFIDTEDIMPENITLATDGLKHVNLMPVYGLNVYSMLKHSTLVLTERAARQIEDKILLQFNRSDRIMKYQLSQV